MSCRPQPQGSPPPSNSELKVTSLIPKQSHSNSLVTRQFSFCVRQKVPSSVETLRHISFGPNQSPTLQALNDIYFLNTGVSEKSCVLCSSPKIHKISRTVMPRTLPEAWRESARVHDLPKPWADKKEVDQQATRRLEYLPIICIKLQV